MAWAWLICVWVLGGEVKVPANKKDRQRLFFAIKRGILRQNLSTSSYKEHTTPKHIADYHAYCQLKQLNYTDNDITKHLSYSNEELKQLVSRFFLKVNRYRIKLLLNQFVERHFYYHLVCVFS